MSHLNEVVAIVRAIAEGRRESADGVGDRFAAAEWRAQADAIADVADALAGRHDAVRPYFLRREAANAVAARIAALRAEALS